MKKIRLLLLALVALMTTGAWAQYYGASSLSNADVQGMENETTKRVLIASPSTNLGYFLGYNNGLVGAVSWAQGASVAALDSTYHFNLIKTSEGTYKIQSVTGGVYIGYSGDALAVGTESEWTIPTLTYGGGTGDSYIQTDATLLIQDGDELVRFVNGNSYYLNSQSQASALKLAVGKGGWSVWKLYEVVEKDPLTGDAVAKIAEGEVVYNNTLSIPRQLSDEKLITSADQLACNQPDPEEGTNIGALIDENSGTYFHSNWHTVTDAPHNLQVSLPNNTYTVFYLKYTNRVAVNDHIKTMEVYGSNDGGSTYSDLLGTVNMPTYASGATGEVGFQLGDTPYTYYKFAVTETNGGRVFYHCAEFQLYPGTDEPLYDVDESYSTALRDAIDALQTKIDNGTPIEQSDIDAVTNAINDITSNTKIDYTVRISGVSGSGTYVTINGEQYADGATVKSSPLTEEDVTPEVVADRKATVTISGTMINVVYSYDYDYTLDPTAQWGDLVVKTIDTELTEGLTPSTDQWYLWKQNRNGETPVYDTGEGATLKRSAVGTDVSLYDKAADVQQYLVRLVQSNEYENAYYIQFGTGRYVGTTPVSSTTPGNYLIYSATQSTSGWTGHYAINKTTNGTSYENILDNNGAGNTLAFWDSGIVSSGANNVWALYPVTIAESELVEYTINIVGDPTSEATVTIEGTPYINGETLQHMPLTINDITVTEIENYYDAVVVSGTDINVTYYLASSAGLNNNSVYTLTTQRGTLHYNLTDENYNATSEEYDAEDGQWAIITSDKGNKYIYNIGAGSFISADAAVTAEPQDMIGVNESGNTSWPIYFTMDENYFNINGEGSLVIDGWTYLDEGNQFRVLYAGAYDLSEVVDAVNDAEDIPTSIEERGNSRNERIEMVKFNLAGQRVDNDYKGIIIKKGKKILNK